MSLKALRLRDGYQKSTHELIAPAHFPGEIASALTKAERPCVNVHMGLPGVPERRKNP
jgi:hypothetical protein